MTLCHELCHLLWDPDERLKKITVDTYEDLENNDNKRDPAEIRANAFAVAFLAPPEAVRGLLYTQSDLNKVVFTVMQTFKYAAPDQSWLARENRTIDYFPFEETPLSRRGMFANYVAELCSRRVLSSDTAASYLKVTADRLNARLPTLLAVTTPLRQ